MTAAAVNVSLAPGVHYDLAEDWYHAMPGLSYSGAKVLLDCPRRYRYERDNPQPPKREFDLGTAAHKLLLGKGATIVEIDADSYRTKKAQDERDAAYAADKVPLLPKEREAAEAMARAIRDSPSGSLFDVGQAEVSLSWTDDETGVPLRARVDWLHPAALVDVKTASSVKPSKLVKAVHEFGYHIQETAYRQAAAACGLGDLPFIFLFVEVKPPHIVVPVNLDADWQERAARDWRRAIDLFDACTATRSWPSYVPDDQILTISLPAYAR